MLPPPRFTVGKVLANGWAVPGFFQTWRLGFRSKSSIFVSTDQRMLFLMVWVLQLPFGKPQVCSFISLVYHTGLMVECFRTGCTSGRSSCLHRATLELCCWSPPWSLLPQSLRCRKSPVCFKLLRFTDDGGICGLWNLQCCTGFSVPFPTESVPWYNPVLEVYWQFLGLHVLGCALISTVCYGRSYRQV